MCFLHPCPNLGWAFFNSSLSPSLVPSPSPPSGTIHLIHECTLLYSNTIYLGLCPTQSSRFYFILHPSPISHTHHIPPPPLSLGRCPRKWHLYKSPWRIIQQIAMQHKLCNIITSFHAVLYTLMKDRDSVCINRLI